MNSSFDLSAPLNRSFLKEKAQQGEKVLRIDDKLIIMLGYIIAYLILLYGYYIYLVPMWSYYGFLWHPDWTKMVEALVYVAIISLVLPVSVRKPSDFFLHLQLLLPILPMLVLYGAMGQPRTYIHAVLLSFGIILTMVKVIRLKPIRTPKISPKDLQTLLLFIGYLVVVSILLQGGWRYFNLSFTKVYVYREAAAANLPAFYGYLNPWVSKVIFPFSFLLAVATRKKIQSFLALLGSILMFGFTSHKGALFYPFSALLLYWITGKKKSIPLLLGGYNFIVILSLLDYWTSIFGGWIATLGLRRIIFVPALLAFNYYNFFLQHGFVYWSHSKITLGLLPYKYELDIAHLIGLHYFGNPATGANTGWIGSGYANAGIAGMAVYAIIIGTIFLFLDAHTKFHDERILISIFIAPLLAIMVSSDLPTAILTHGALIGLLLLTFFRTRRFPTRQRWKFHDSTAETPP